MQLTRAADYAIRVMVHLATLPPGSRNTRDELAITGEVPEHFLGKILQALSRGGLIESHRGMAGGFSLSKPPEAVSVLDVIEAIEGPVRLNPCVAPGLGCTRKRTCPVFPVWMEAQEKLTTVLRSATLARLAEQASRFGSVCGGMSWS